MLYEGRTPDTFYSIITESSDDHTIIQAYKSAHRIILYALDKPEFHLFNEGYYTISIEKIHIKSNNEIVFSFQFDKIYDNEESFKGEVTIDPNDSFTPTSFKKWKYSIPDDRPHINDKISDDNDKCNLPETKSTVTVNPPIELSSNVFSIEEENTVEVACPELEIGTVEKNTFQVDTKRQAAQDEFLKNINRKFSGHPL